MATPFVLDVNLRIQQVLGLAKVKQQLAGIQTGNIGQLSAGLKSVGVNAATAASHISKGATATNRLGKSAQITGKNLGVAAKQAATFGDQIFLAGKRYAAFLAATVVAFKGVQLIGTATKSVIEFDQAMVSLSQILNKSVDQLGDLSQQFLDLSIKTGTSAAEISNAAKLLAQAGFRGNELTEAVEQLAKIPLTPIFQSMEQSIDGVIAAMRQFNNEGLTVEQVFDKMLKVQNDYAASFPDIIEGLKRGGSAFQAIGGTLDEFIAAFVTIRSVTRESSSAVGTSLKTLSSRLGDPKITKFLETKNIRIFEKGQFVGPIEAIRRIGGYMENNLDLQENLEILTKLGGRRQFSRVIALARNAKLTEEILGKSQNAWGTLNRTAEQGLQAVGKQLDIIVAKAKKLAIELGESVFLPFIQGLASAAEGAITLIGALKPILPIVTKLGALFAGTAILGGLGSFLGPKIGQLAGPAAFAAAGGGARGIGAGIVASPFAQAGLLIAASELAASFFKTADGTDAFSTTLITSTAAITAAIAIFRKQTIAQFAAGGGLFPSLGRGGILGKIGGTLATAGAIALPLAIIQAQRSAEKLSDKIIDTAVKSIESIELQPPSPKSLEDNISKLYEAVGDSVRGLIDSADVRKRPTIGNLFEGIGRTLGNVFEGDYEALIKRGGLTQRDVKNHIQRILENSPRLINSLIESTASSLLVGGEVDQTPFIARRKLVEGGLDRGLDTQQANQFASDIIESAGGLEVWTNKVNESAKIIADEADNRKKILQLTSQVIPPRLVGQLLQFSKAIDKTTRLISTSAKLFEGDIAIIRGGIQAPSFDFDFGAQQIEQLVRTNGLKDLFAFTPDIPRFVGGISEIEDLIDQFIINVSNLPSGVDIGSEIDKFFEFQRNVPESVRNNFESFFQTIAEDIQLASEGKLIDPEEIKRRFKQEFADIGLGASNAAVETIGQFLRNTFDRLQDELNRLAVVRGLELAVPVRPESQAVFLEQQLRRSGIYATGRTPSTQQRGTFDELSLLEQERTARGGRAGTVLPSADFFEGRGRRLADVAGDERVRQQARDSFRRLTLELSEVRGALANLKLGSQDFVATTERAGELSRKIIELQTSMEGLSQGTKQALDYELQTLKLKQQLESQQQRERIEERGMSPLRAQRIMFDLQQEHLQEQLSLQDKFDIIVEKDNALRAELAKEVSASTKTQAEVVQNFDMSVGIFGDATRAQMDAAQMMKHHITSFGQAVVDFSNLGELSRPGTTPGSPGIIPSQIRSGAVTIQQAQEALEGFSTELNANNKAVIDVLQAIQDRQNDPNSPSQKTIETELGPETVGQTNEQIGQLTESLDGLRTALAEPNELRVVTDQRIDLDLSTLPSDIEAEVRPILEEAVMVMAKTITRKAFESLAAKGDSEISIAASDTAQELV